MNQKVNITLQKVLNAKKVKEERLRKEVIANEDRLRKEVLAKLPPPTPPVPLSDYRILATNLL